MGWAGKLAHPLTMAYTITNGYATLEEVKAEAAIESIDGTDDDVLARCIEDASRAVDVYTGRQFFAASAARYFDTPLDGDRRVYLGGDWLTVSAITNGDGSSVAASLVDLLPINAVSHDTVRLKNSASAYWSTTTGGDYLGAIQISGSTGYVDRTSTDPRSAVVISNTKRAAIITALAYYRKRMGIGGEAVTVTAAGLVLSPQGLPRDAVQLIEGYRVMP